jgi:cation diffusion facilitator family transporter
MRVQGPYQLPEDKERLRRRAARLEWVSLGWMASIVVVVGLAMGSSQAMKAAWVEDLLSLVPPVAFLVASRIESRPPSERFPYGYRRAKGISFLIAAVALLVFGALLLADSLVALLSTEHPTVGTLQVAGRTIWMGWLMAAALLYSVVPPMILGRRKLLLASKLHDKTLHADASMNRADWLTGVAGIGGILGVGLGWWWADAVAAGIISLDVLHDGVVNVRRVVEDLMDRRPQTVGGDEPHPVATRLRLELETLPWVHRAEVRLREDGQVLIGEAFLVVGDPGADADLPARLARAGELARGVDWRVHEVVVTVVPDLPPPGQRR